MTMHQMNILDHTGHTTVSWDPNNATEVATAEANFDSMIEQGYRAFRIEGANQQGKRIEQFDRTAAKIMFLPHLVGG
jgi:hypothetical protein